MTKISPSLLSADLANLARDAQMVLDAGADMLHFDAMDGHFVPNISMGIPVLKSLHEALPHAVVDAHLMIENPADYIPQFAKAGASIITIHYETVDDPGAVIDLIHQNGCKAGMAINPETTAEVLFPWLEQLELVLVMSIKPGFSGQKFMPMAPKKLQYVKQQCDAKGLTPYIQVDGGINLTGGTGAQCVQAGANLLVAGNAVFTAADPAAAVRNLRAL